MNSTEFLLAVWKIHCQEGDFVCLSSKKGKTWVDYCFPFNGELSESITNWLSKHEDKNLYFCPLPFSEPRRAKPSVVRSRMLWSDIDGADPHKVEPSILWESSPGRHQGLWVLPQEADPSVAAEQSRQLAYYIGADRGGWDLTQVLRIPGTINYKYPDHPVVKLLYFKPEKILRKLPKSPLERWRKSIPLKLIRMIEGPATEGKRSDVLWYLEHELCDLGIPIDDAIAILQNSDWNKYRGRADEAERFRAEREKIVGDREETRVESLILKIEDYSELMGKNRQSPGWMIPGYWMKESHGIIAGEPKSFKTTLVLDMMFSVASNTSFLGVHPVQHGGPTLFVQNENADWIMRDKLQKLSVARGTVGRARVQGQRLNVEWSKKHPMHFINQQGFTLDDASYKEALEDTILQLRPAMVVLDPLYLMFSGDVNSAKDLNPVLNWCLRIRQEYSCAVILVHHYNKGGEGRRSGQRMLGSTTLHGWIESAWYIQAHEPDGPAARVTLDREFRGAGLHPKQDLHIRMGDIGDMAYSIMEEEVSNEGNNIVQLLEQSTEALSKSHMAKALGISRYQVDKLVDKLVQDGILTRRGERYQLKEET